MAMQMARDAMDEGWLPDNIGVTVPDAILALLNSTRSYTSRAFAIDHRPRGQGSMDAARSIDGTHASQPLPFLPVSVLV